MPERALLPVCPQPTDENGYTITWLAAARVLWLRFSNTGRAAVDSAAAELQRRLDAWQCDEPLRLLLDLREDEAVISPHGLRRFREVTRYRPDVTLRVALLTEDRLSLEIAALARRGMCLGPRCRHVSASDERRALAWLLMGTTIAVTPV